MNEEWSTESLPELGDKIFDRLLLASKDRVDPWRLPVLAAVGPDGPDARVVVLREVRVGSRELVVYTDLRSPKVSQLRAHPKAVLVFYDSEVSVQLRATCVARIYVHPDPETAVWEALAESQRQNYRSLLAPGQSIESLAEMGLAGVGTGIENFAVIVFRVDLLDWLWLARQGHRRARLHPAGSGWSGTWVVP